MIHPQVDAHRWRWDYYKAFHMIHAGASYGTSPGAIVQFDTGEMIFTSYAAHHTQRGKYSNLGLTLVGTQDAKLPRMALPDGREVKKSWFTKQYTLLCDWHTGHVVSLEPIVSDELAKQGVPSRFTKIANAYYPGEKRLPVGQSIPLVIPAPVTTEQRRAVRELKQQCQMWLSMIGETWTAPNGDDYEYVDVNNHAGEQVRVYRDDTPINIADAATWTFAELPNETRASFAVGTFTAGTQDIVVPHLKLLGGQSC